MPATRRMPAGRSHHAAAAVRSSTSQQVVKVDKGNVHRVPLVTHDYRADPRPFPALKTEQGVFTTPPYSAEIKGLWRFKDEAAARESAEAIWQKFVGYRDLQDFVGMEISRKFIQMGRTRSLRYALRQGGKKYETAADGSKKAMKRTGEVYDEGKLKGANVFEGYLDRCWADEEYKRAFERWRKGERWWPSTSEAGGSKRLDEGDVKLERMEEDDMVKQEPDMEGGDETRQSGDISVKKEPRA